MPLFLVCFIIIVAPLAIGTVQTWSLAMMELLIFLALLWSLKKQANKNSYIHPPGVLPLSLLLLYLLLQLLPLPVALLEYLSPATIALYQLPESSFPVVHWLPLSVSPESTLQELLRFSSYSAFYVVLTQLLVERKVLKLVLKVVVTIGGLIAFQAIIQFFAGNGKIFWLVNVPDGAQIRGPFIYKNHFAGYVGLVTPLALTLFLSVFPVNQGATLRQKIASFFSALRLDTFVLSGLTLFSLIIAMAASSSRGGILSLCAGILFFFFLLGTNHYKNRTIKGVVCFAVCAIVGSGLIGWQLLDHLFGKTFNAAGELTDGRLDVWKDCLALIRDFPLFGTGAGTFECIYQKYRTFAGEFFYYDAHNDYIQLLTDTGIVGLLLVGWFVATVLFDAYRVGRQRRDSFARILSFGALAGALTLLFHCVTDFQFQCGANALYFFLLLAMAVSAAHTKSHGRTGSTLSTVASEKWRPAITAITACLFLTTTMYQAGQWHAEQVLSPVDRTALNAETPDEIAQKFAVDLESALKFAPLNAHLHFRLAQVFKHLGLADTAQPLFQQAIRLYPGQPVYHLFYAYFLSDRHQFVDADAFMRSMVACAPYSAEYRRYYAQWLLNHEQAMRGIEVYAQVFSMAPGEVQNDIAYLAQLGVHDETIWAALPKRVGPQLAFASYLIRKGDANAAAAVFETALEAVQLEPAPRSSFFTPAITYYKKKNQFDDALRVTLQGVAVLPSDATLLNQAGELYQHLNNIEKSLFFYQQALQQSPNNAALRNKIQALESLRTPYQY